MLLTQISRDTAHFELPDTNLRPLNPNVRWAPLGYNYIYPNYLKIILYTYRKKNNKKNQLFVIKTASQIKVITKSPRRT